MQLRFTAAQPQQVESACCVRGGRRFCLLLCDGHMTLPPILRHDESNRSGKSEMETEKRKKTEFRRDDTD